MNEFAWLPEDAPATRLFNPAKASSGMENTPCWLEAQFSIFFDGTRNHRDEDSKSGSHSNVARLFDTCNEEPEQAQFRLYVQGVGTPFLEIDEEKPHETGAQKGTYGDRRMRYAFLFMANELARLLYGNVIVKETIPDMIRAIKDPGQVKVWRRQLEEMLAKPKPAAPVIPMITLDLFGFSRGATAARSFLSHLMEWAGDGQPKVCGIPLRVRFMGLFDTVASVERADSVPGPSDGHMDWATPDRLVIPPFVEQCVHMVAAHEARNSFPLTTIAATREQAPKRLEITYPGMHADVGGGYGPTSQGKGTDLGEQRIRQEQGDLLSQIPLNDMYERARTAAVPLIGRDEFPLRRVDTYFAISPELQRSFDAYQSTMQQYRGGAPLLRQLHSHYLAYLGWRKQVLSRPTFIAKPFMVHCEKTQPQDHVNLDQSNAEFQVYIQPFTHTAGRMKVKLGSVAVWPNYLTRQRECMDMYDRYWGAAPAPKAAVSALLEQYMHDSRAGFVLTDPQCERDYQNMHDHLEARDKQYKESLRLYAEDAQGTRRAYERALDAHENFSPKAWMETRPPHPGPPPVPQDPLNAADRAALEQYRAGRKPIFTDARPASSMDGKLDVLDAIALASRREVRWSYLRRRQVFRPVIALPMNIPRGGTVRSASSTRLSYEDGLT